MRTVLAVDPGREKCGIAVVSDEGLLAKEVVPRVSIADRVAELAAAQNPGEIIVGNGTGGAELASELEELGLGIPLQLVDETRSSERARSRFFEDNPPRGFRKLIPRGLLTPSRPYDDYVAQILAEDYLGIRNGV